MKSPITQWWRQSVVHRDARGFFSVGNEKFTLNLSNCPDCKLAEYACICDHAHCVTEHAKHRLLFGIHFWVSKKPI